MVNRDYNPWITREKRNKSYLITHEQAVISGLVIAISLSILDAVLGTNIIL